MATNLAKTPSAPITPTEERVAVAPDAVRVWRGFRNRTAPNTWETFTAFLGTTLFPVEATLRPWFGLTCYVAGIKAEHGDPRVPDEFALVFYESQAVYDRGLETVAGSIYPLFPAPQFGAGHSGYPTALGAALLPGTPSFVFDEPVDWFHGHVRCLLGAAPAGISAEALCAEATSILGSARARQTPGLDGAIVMVDENDPSVGGSYLLYWEHWSAEPVGGPMDALAAKVDVAFRRSAEPMEVRGGGFYDRGVHTVPAPVGDQLLRLRFARRALLAAEQAPVWGPLRGP